MTDLEPFPDIHEVTREVIAAEPAIVPLANIGTDTPADLLAVAPFIRVRRLGGTDDWITDRPRVDVDVFAATAAQAWQVARDVQQRLISSPRATAAGVLDQCRTEVGPQEVPYVSDDVRRVTATYRASVRR